jgi:hypothetical protein
MVIVTGPQTAGLDPGDNIFNTPLPQNNGRPAKNLYAESGRLTIRCRVTWAWSEGVNWYSREILIVQILIVQRQTKNMQLNRDRFRAAGPR